MLLVKWIDKQKNILVVTEVIHSFYETIKTNWYYDLNKKIVSEKEDFPEGLYTTKLDQYKIDWVNKYYIPLIKK